MNTESLLHAGPATVSDDPLWRPSPARIADEPLTRFMHQAAACAGHPIPGYAELHAWSLSDRGAFWSLLWDFCEVVGTKGDTALEQGAEMIEDHFFPNAQLNYAENLLRSTGDGDAVVFRAEDKMERRLSWDELRAQVSRLQQLLVSLGVEPGDRVAAMMPNMPETVAAMLATASIGAVWASCSPDFGVASVLDRFAQIDPVVLIVPDGYWYGGKTIDLGEKIVAVADGLPSVRAVLVAALVGNRSLPIGALALDEALAPFAPAALAFARLPFAHPLSVHFSSGTTAAPKCIVHTIGGTLLQHLKEHRLHSGLRAGDRLFYFTTCGWMMWNWLVSGLASDATLLLFDGSPTYPDFSAQFAYAEAERATHFGTSAKFIDGLRKSGCRPGAQHDLAALRTVLSTGSPLSSDGFAYVYDAVKADVHLASIAGGTDIMGCFVLGVPTLPVWPGEIQAPGLGMAVNVLDEQGETLSAGRGELACIAAFPSMPLGFWNDDGKRRYRATYFERFDDIWCHGDFAEWTNHGGMIIHGRSDATLNPGGVRIGTAEIYNQVERMDEVAEAVCIGQAFDGDVRVVLFVRLADGGLLDAALEQCIRSQIRIGASPRHVPAKIIAVADIPRTTSGKISELAVRDVVNGLPVGNRNALANPNTLELYRDLPELRS